MSAPRRAGRALQDSGLGWGVCVQATDQPQVGVRMSIARKRVQQLAAAS